MNVDKIFWFNFGMSSSKGYRNAENNLPISLISWQAKLPVLLNDMWTKTKHFGLILVCHPQKGIEMPKIICQSHCSLQTRPLVLQHDMNVYNCGVWHNYCVVLVIISSEGIKYTKDSMQPTNYQKIHPDLFLCTLFLFKSLILTIYNKYCILYFTIS